MDTVTSTLIDTVELFQECGAKAKEQSLLHSGKPVSSAALGLTGLQIYKPKARSLKIYADGNNNRQSI